MTACCSLTKATKGVSRKSTSPTRTLEASASLGSFFMNLFFSWTHAGWDFNERAQIKLQHMTSLNILPGWHSVPTLSWRCDESNNCNCPTNGNYKDWWLHVGLFILGFSKGPLWLLHSFTLNSEEAVVTSIRTVKLILFIWVVVVPTSDKMKANFKGSGICQLRLWGHAKFKIYKPKIISTPCSHNHKLLSNSNLCLQGHHCEF